MTVTTVGYGDRYPVTPAGRGVAVVLMLVGIGLIGVVTANVASYFVTQEVTDESARLQALEARLARIEELLVVISTQTAPANGVLLYEAQAGLGVSGVKTAASTTTNGA